MMNYTIKPPVDELQYIHNYSFTQRASPEKILGSLTNWRHSDLGTVNCNYKLFTTSRYFLLLFFTGNETFHRYNEKRLILKLQGNVKNKKKK